MFIQPKSKKRDTEFHLIEHTKYTKPKKAGQNARGFYPGRKKNNNDEHDFFLYHVLLKSFLPLFSPCKKIKNLFFIVVNVHYCSFVKNKKRKKERV